MRGASWIAVVAVLALGAPALAYDLPPVLMTEFDPRRDGLPFANVGDMARPGGNCWGMSLLAIDNYLRRLDRGTEGERALAHEQYTQRPNEADPVQQATAGLLQATTAELDGGRSAVPVEARRRVPLSDPSPVLEALERIGQTGVPEVLVIQGPKSAHAVVLYGYRDGKVRVYDPNFPGEAIDWPFDPARGLGPHPRGEYEFYAGLTHASTTPYEAHRTSAAMDRLREACSSQDATCTGRYPTIRAALERTAGGVLVIDGQVQAPVDGGALPQRVWLAVNGQPVGAAEVSRYGTFYAVVSEEALAASGDNVVRVIGETTTSGHAQFAGFADLPVATPTGTEDGPLTRSLRPRARPEGLAPTTSQRPKARPASRGLTGALRGE